MGKKIAAQVLPDLQGKGLVRQRSISADLIFWLLFVPGGDYESECCAT
jgi:hypothetical protein